MQRFNTLFTNKLTPWRCSKFLPLAKAQGSAGYPQSNRLRPPLAVNVMTLVQYVKPQFHFVSSISRDFFSVSVHNIGSQYRCPQNRCLRK